MHTRLDGALQIRGSYLHASMVVGFALMIRTLLARLTLLARKLS
jgi:TRAP-type transport system small permease protein